VHSLQQATHALAHTPDPLEHNKTMLALAAFTLAMPTPLPVHPECPLPANAEFVKTGDGLDVAVYKSGDIVSDAIRKTGSWETHPWKALQPFMSKGTTFVDIGANIGWYTVNLARHHPVVAFEPFKANLDLLGASLCANPALKSNVKVMAHGLSNSARRCDLYQVPSVNFGDTVSACDGDGSASDERRAALAKNGYQKLGEMKAYPLNEVVDAALLEADKVVKMDVEGHEHEVILGAETFFTQGKPPRAVYAEVFQLGDKRSAFFAKMKEWGYETKAGEKDNDALFVRSEAAAVPKVERLMTKGQKETRHA